MSLQKELSGSSTRILKLTIDLVKVGGDSVTNSVVINVKDVGLMQEIVLLNAKSGHKDAIVPNGKVVMSKGHEIVTSKQEMIMWNMPQVFVLKGVMTRCWCGCSSM